MGEVQTIHLRGQGGHVIAHDLPLSEDVSDQVTKGHLRRVNPDGTDFEPEPDSPAPDVAVPPAVKPAANAPKAEWIGWAVAKGARPDDAEAMTKTDLVEKFGR